MLIHYIILIAVLIKYILYYFTGEPETYCYKAYG